MPSDSPAAVVRGTGVEKVYTSATGEVHALQAVDLEVEPARITSIVGPSGSGKSTLLRIIGCLDRATAGRVEVDGIDVGRLSGKARRQLRRAAIGYVFQSPDRNLLPYLSAAEHLDLAARLRPRGAPPGTTPGIAPGAAPGTADQVESLLELLGLSDRRRARPAELSGGEQQRLAVAMAVVGRPRLIIADEPTAELDSASADRVVSLMQRLRDDGATVIVASHDQIVVSAADRTVLLSHGSIER